MSENQSEVISDVTKKVVIETEQDKEKSEGQ